MNPWHHRKKTFKAILEPLGNGLGWTIARIPFDPAKTWPNKKNHRIRGTVNGFGFRTSYFPGTAELGPFLMVNKKMLAGAKARRGDRVEITLEPDMEEREVVIPPEFERLLKQDHAFRKWFNTMSPSMRREIGKFVGEPKSAESRQKRAEDMAERLLSAMEGEQVTPPILRVLFARHPKAEAGWKAMTPIQRRGHLYGIFYYRSVEAREKRAQKAVDECLRVAEKTGNRTDINV